MHKSFLKWAGGKAQLLDKIISLMPPDNKKRYLEPFVGSGIVALNVDFPEIIIADVNKPLIDLWKTLKEEGDLFIEESRGFFDGTRNNAKAFYQLREHFNDSPIPVLFLYLNRHCFNGLCRFNSKGKFNVPFGRYKNPYFPEKELFHAGEILKKTEIYCSSFIDTMSIARPGDVIYCDPPYMPVGGTSNFTAYSTGGFSMREQEQLAIHARVAKDCGATVIISNNDVPAARKLYKETRADEIHFVQVQKKISCTAANRKKLQEIIAVYRPMV